jgi:hypothetical protein
MASSTEAITSSLQLLDEAKLSYLAGEAKSTEAVIDAARAILAAGGQDPKASSLSSNTDHEKPSDFLQRVMWAEVRVIASKSMTYKVVFSAGERIFVLILQVEVTFSKSLRASYSPSCRHS